MGGVVGVGARPTGPYFVPCARGFSPQREGFDSCLLVCFFCARHAVLGALVKNKYCKVLSPRESRAGELSCCHCWRSVAYNITLAGFVVSCVCILLSSLYHTRSPPLVHSVVGAGGGSCAVIKSQTFVSLGYSKQAVVLFMPLLAFAWDDHGVQFPLVSTPVGIKMYNTSR